MNIVILAAGKGTRMRSALPKVLHTLAGKPLLFHVIDTALKLNPSKLIVVVGHEGEQVQTSVQKAYPQGNIQFATQMPQQGTGHAVQQAVPYLVDNGATLVLYGDVPLTSLSTLEALIAVTENSTRDSVGLLTANLTDATGYGRIVRNQSEQVTAIVEHKDASEAERKIREINTGIMLLPTGKLKYWLSNLSNNNQQKEYYLTDVIAMSVADGVTVSTHQPEWLGEIAGINDPVQMATLERDYQLRLAHQLMTSGVKVMDPNRLDIRGELSCGRDVVLDINTLFEGKVALGNNVTIGAHCILKNVTLADGVQVAPYSHLDGAIVGENSKIGPYARLRPGAELAAEVHIGNFVEVKNSQVGYQSKANHLSYIGDATIGQRVNIGAGTITCNYDGVNKHRTVIEDDVFVGSDTQLVAPVTVGKGATLGAGTTLTSNAPADTLTVSRAKQVSIPTWKRPVKR